MPHSTVPLLLGSQSQGKEGGWECLFKLSTNAPLSDRRRTVVSTQRVTLSGRARE